jgi:hypothetical protein
MSERIRAALIVTGLVLIVSGVVTGAVLVNLFMMRWGL